MKKATIIYWSSTGNTEKMGEYLKVNLDSKGFESNLVNVAQATLEDVTISDLVLLGSPAMGAEVIEEDEMEPFVESIKEVISGKDLILFGSYDWGDGQWMREWTERMKSYGANVLGEGLIVQNTPEDDIEIKTYIEEVVK